MTDAPFPMRANNGTIGIANPLHDNRLQPRIDWRATAEDLGAQLLTAQDDLRQSRSMHKEAVRVMTIATEECNQFHRVQRVRYDRAYDICTRWTYIFLPKSVRLLLSDLMDPT